MSARVGRLDCHAEVYPLRSVLLLPRWSVARSVEGRRFGEARGVDPRRALLHGDIREGTAVGMYALPVYARGREPVRVRAMVSEMGAAADRMDVGVELW